MRKLRQKASVSWQRTIRTVFWILLIAFVVMNTGFGCNPNGTEGYTSQGCISIVLDRVPVLLSNKAILYHDNKVVEITDRRLLLRLAAETAVATNGGLCYDRNSTTRIELYCGDWRVRDMIWSWNEGDMVVYKADVLHWIFGFNTGHVMPSAELTSELKALFP